jgi:hypothetical protein
MTQDQVDPLAPPDPSTTPAFALEESELGVPQTDDDRIKVGKPLVDLLEQCRSARGLGKGDFAKSLNLHMVQYTQLVSFTRAFSTLSGEQLRKIAETVNRSLVEIYSYAGMLSIADFLRPSNELDRVDTYFDTIAGSDYIGGLLSREQWDASPLQMKLVVIVMWQRLECRRLLQLTDPSMLAFEPPSEEPMASGE